MRIFHFKHINRILATFWCAIFIICLNCLQIVWVFHLLDVYFYTVLYWVNEADVTSTITVLEVIYSLHRLPLLALFLLPLTSTTSTTSNIIFHFHIFSISSNIPYKVGKNIIFYKNMCYPRYFQLLFLSMVYYVHKQFTQPFAPRQAKVVYEIVK